ncbi:MAG: NAD(P)-dependent oxidoreductase [Pseudomonadota bacterium]
MRVGVLGAGGVIGRRLLPLLAAAGHEPVALARTVGALHGAAAVRRADILDAGALRQAVADLDAVVNLATSIPDGRGRGDWAQNDRIRIEGTENLARAIAAAGRPCRWVQQSVAMLHQGAVLAHEDCELSGQGVLTSAVLMEAMVQGSPLDWTLVRGGALYGADTARDAAFFGRIAAGTLRAPADAERWISFVHVDDLAAAFLQALALPPRRAYIAADDLPTTYARLFARLGVPAQGVDAAVLQPLPSFRVSNRRLRGCGWVPQTVSVYDWVDAALPARAAA